MSNTSNIDSQSMIISSNSKDPSKGDLNIFVISNEYNDSNRNSVFDKVYDLIDLNMKEHFS